MAILGAPFGVVMRLIFDLVQNYGLALFLFTVLSRLVMIPLTIKQTKSSAKMAVIQPQIQEINKKYAGNRQKINEESMALYQKVGYSPAAGCLPMLAQMIILFGMIDVILRPLTHILRIPANVLDAANDMTAGLGDMGARMMNAMELGTLNAIDLGLADYSTVIPGNYLTQIHGFLPQMNFLGVNLMETPNPGMLLEVFTNFNPVLLIPILSGITSVMLTMATMGQMATPQTPGMPNMKVMMWMMPVFSTVFTFTIHAGVGIYWIFANIVGYVQAKILSKFFNPKLMAEKHKQELEELKERERMERQERKKRAKERGETDEVDIESLSKKEQNRRKLAEARRRDAEKYGDVYTEDED